jgi:hypothetical protein
MAEQQPTYQVVAAGPSTEYMCTNLGHKPPCDDDEDARSTEPPAHGRRHADMSGAHALIHAHAAQTCCSHAHRAVDAHKCSEGGHNASHQQQPQCSRREALDAGGAAEDIKMFMRMPQVTERDYMTYCIRNKGNWSQLTSRLFVLRYTTASRLKEVKYNCKPSQP